MTGEGGTPPGGGVAGDAGGGAGGAAGFQDVVATLDYPMYVVTTAAGDERAGCLVGFTSQCSIDPPRFAVWLSKSNRTYRVARGAEILAVHALGEGERDLAELFGHHTGDQVDKFARCSWRPGPAGVPVLDDCPRWFAGRILDHWDTGDHLGFLLEPLAAAAEADEDDLGFQDLKGIEPGHEA